MRALFCSVVALSFALAAQPAVAQDVEPMYQRLETAMAEAQAQAVRPGDEALTCDQLQNEMATTMQDPAVQSVIAQQGVEAQQQIDQMNALSGQARTQMGVSMFLGIASAFIPGLGYAQLAQQQAMAAQQRQQAQQSMALRMAQAERMTTIMPQMMRGQRITELAQAQQCSFLQDQGLPPPQ